LFPHLQHFSLFCLENFELNKTKFPLCHVCGWDTLVCQPHPCSHILRSTHEFAAYTMNGEHQKKLRAIRFRKDRMAKFVPIGIPILQSAATPNGIVTHAAQRTHCNRPFAKRWRIRPPGLNLGRSAPLSAKRRDFSRAAGLQLL